MNRIRKMQDDKGWFWFFRYNVQMNRSHALLHFSNDRLRAARAEAA